MSPKIIVGETSCVSEIFWFPNFLDNTGITILSIVFVTQCRKICREPSNDSNNLGYPRFLCIMGEFHVFPRKTFSLTVPKNLVGERFCLSEKFQYGKSLWIRSGCHVFPSMFLCRKTPKNIVGEHFCVSEMFWYQKILDNRVITILPYFFVSHRQESSRANPSVFKNYSCFKISWIIGVLRFCRLSKITGKHRGRTLLFFRNVLTSKLFWVIVVSQLCRIFRLTSPKIIVGEPFYVSEIFCYQNNLDKRGMTIMSNV